MLSLLLASLIQSPSVIGPDDVIGQVATTGMTIKIPLHGYTVNADGLRNMRKKFADRGLILGAFAAPDTTVSIVAAYGVSLPSEKWLEQLLGTMAVGAGQFKIGTTACTEHVRELNAPFKDLGWHAFPVVGQTCFDIQIFTLMNGETAPLKREDFVKIVESARYAVVRVGEWSDYPLEYLDRSHEGLARGENEAVSALVEAAKTAKDAWACSLAAAEIGRSLKHGADELLPLCQASIDGLAKIEKPSKIEQHAQLVALDALGLAQRDAGKAADALVTLTHARDLGVSGSLKVRAVLAYDLATAHALNKDVANTIVLLKEAFAEDPDRKLVAVRDPAFEVFHADESFQDLFGLKKPAGKRK